MVGEGEVCGEGEMGERRGEERGGRGVGEGGSVWGRREGERHGGGERGRGVGEERGGEAWGRREGAGEGVGGEGGARGGGVCAVKETSLRLLPCLHRPLERKTKEKRKEGNENAIKDRRP